MEQEKDINTADNQQPQFPFPPACINENKPYSWEVVKKLPLPLRIEHMQKVIQLYPFMTYADFGRVFDMPYNRMRDIFNSMQIYLKQNNRSRFTGVIKFCNDAHIPIPEYYVDKYKNTYGSYPSSTEVKEMMNPDAYIAAEGSPKNLFTMRTNICCKATKNNLDKVLLFVYIDIDNVVIRSSLINTTITEDIPEKIKAIFTILNKDDDVEIEINKNVG